MKDGLRRTSLAALSVLLLIGLVSATCIPAVRAQVQYLSVSPGVINLGMTTSITVVAPGPGDFSVVVVGPDNSSLTLNYSFSAAGQTESAVFGNSSLGFKTVVTQAGTYNVFLEHTGQVVSAASFYATDKLNVWMDFVDGGLCNYVAGATRGEKVFPRFYITYASNGAPLNKSASVFVTYTLPDGSMANASYHRATAEAPFPYGFYIGKFYANWNYTAVGPWSPKVVIGDGLGNTATYQYVGPAFEVSPTQLSTSVQLIDTKTSQMAGGLYDGQTVQLRATITYPNNPEPVPGFLGDLDSARGGAVAALVGWGFYNATSGSFGSSENPGGLIARVPMTYTGSNGTWAGTLDVSKLPSIAAGTSYEVVVASSDSASPPNMGLDLVNVPPASFAPGSPAPTTVTQTVSGGQPAAGTNATSTAGQGQISFSLALMTAVGTLIVGLIAGMVVRPTREPRGR